jgi:transcriptional regulator with XRE-family HTH domain
MTIDDYRVSLGWTRTKLCEEAGVDMSTLQRATKGDPIYRLTAGKIAEAFNRELKRRGEPTIRYTDFEGVKFSD